MSALDELKIACQKTEIFDQRKALQDGELLTLIGRPSFANKGYISLEMAQGATVTVAEDSVVEVERESDYFVVSVKAMSTALVKFEYVSTIIDRKIGGCGCNQTPEPDTSSIARSSSGFNAGGLGEIINCIDCHIEWFCSYWTGKTKLYKFCVPAPVCRNICDGGPA